MLLRSHRQQHQQPPQRQCLFICAITFLCLRVHGYTTTTPTTTATTTNTRTLSSKVPSCAFPCAERFLESQFPISACPDRSDTTCFCKTHTHSGYTLGEGVLQCMLEFCPGSTVDEYGEGAYAVCDGVQGAVPRTHETITATVVGSTGGGVVATGTGTGTGTGKGTGISTMTGTRSTRTSPDTSTTSAKPTATTFQPPVPATGTGTATTSDNTDGTLSPSSSSSSSPSSSPNASTTPASDTDSGKDTHSLNAGSVVGVSVASGLSGFFLIAALLFLWRRKLKRRQQQKANYFEIGGHMSEPPDFGIPPRRPTPGPRLPPPPPTPTPPPKSAGRDAEPEMSRLMSPFEPRPRPQSQSQSRPPNPAVVVTGVDGEEGYGYGYGYDSGVEEEDERLGPGAGRIGRAISSNFDQDSPDGCSTMTERAPSDLLPPKPESSELYPEPLRWDRQREEYSRPRSDVTTFEEEDVAQPRSLLSPNGYPNFSGLIGPRPYPGRPMAGLPAHPRAMMYGFTPQNHLPPKRAQGQPMKPVYTSPAPSVPSPYEAGDRSSRCTQSQSQSQSQTSGSGSGSGSGSDDCNGGDYGLVKTQGLQKQQDWQPSRSAGANHHYSPTMRPWHPRESLDTSDISDSGFETQRTSRHSGFFTPLPPVREVRTPTRVESPIDYSTSPAIRYPRVPGLGPGSASGSRAGSKPSTPTLTPTPAATPDPAREIVSKPRIVRQHDIKRVEIRRGKRQSRSKQQRQQRLPQPFQFRNLNAVPPYSPDDFWYDPECRQSASQESSSGTSAAGVASAPTPTIHRLSWGFGPPPVEKTITRKPMKRRSMGQSQGQGEGQHQLTPSRRGDDLILRVD